MWFLMETKPVANSKRPLSSRTAEQKKQATIDILSDYFDSCFSDTTPEMDRSAEVLSESNESIKAIDNASMFVADPSQNKRTTQSQNQVKSFGNSSTAYSSPLVPYVKTSASRNIAAVDYQPELAERPVVIPALMPKMAPTETPESQALTQSDLVKSSEIDATLPIDPANERPLRKAQVIESSSEPAESISAEPPTPNSRVTAFRDHAEFEALLFSVKGLTLAVPLVSLGSIHKIEHGFTPIVGRAPWFMGLYRVGERNLQVVDTSAWVMPNKHESLGQDDYQFLIRLGDSNWTLACDKVLQSMKINQDEIKWRTKQGKRSWLAGTLKSHMCALLDVERMSVLLDQDRLHIDN
jgi:purine-binding chemotaxis protein CheW